MSAKSQLIYSIRQFLKHNKHGSYATQKKRELDLCQMAKDLTENGYKLKHVKGLKQKHICMLNRHWQERGLSPATIKNKNAQLRWVCGLLGKSNMVPSNDLLGVVKREYSTNVNKAVDISAIDFTRMSDSHMRAYIYLQRYLGLRREEALKLKPHMADHGDYLKLEGAWCKGGRSRVVPILTDDARKAVDFAKSLVSSAEQSLIPTEKSYIQRRHFYDKQMQRAGVKHPHGLRHAYAQARYFEITGWQCPACGGLSRKQLSVEKQTLDRIARQVISEELGHSRPEITVQYLSG